ncbi:MAG: adenylate/guanylate cyclase domain-containing protein [Bacteroidales bacterium]
MVKFIHFRNPVSTEIEETLKNIPKCPGVCFFIDIINSTDIKYKTRLWEWGKKLNNTFNFISFLNDLPDNVVKGIGDELMLYIPDSDLKAKSAYNNYLSLIEEIYATIDNIKNYPIPDVFLSCKVGIHYCTEVYNITFFEGANDYYGRDIDLAARLMSKAKANRIVLSEPFHAKIQNDLLVHDISREDTCLKHLSGKYIEDFKGVPHPTEYRIIDV